MCADGRADQNLCVSGSVETDFAGLVQQGGIGQLVLLFHFLSSQSSNEHGGAVPDDLQDLSGRDFRDIHLEVGVAVVSSPSVEPADDCHCVEAGEVGHGCVVDGAEHVDLSPADVGFVLVVHSVLIEPVIEVSLEVDVIAEVSWPRRRDKELRLVGNGVVVIELARRALVVLSDEAKVERPACLTLCVLLLNCASRLAFDKNNIQINYLQNQSTQLECREVMRQGGEGEE